MDFLHRSVDLQGNDRINAQGATIVIPWFGATALQLVERLKLICFLSWSRRRYEAMQDPRVRRDPRMAPMLQDPNFKEFARLMG